MINHALPSRCCCSAIVMHFPCKKFPACSTSWLIMHNRTTSQVCPSATRTSFLLSRLTTDSPPRPLVEGISKLKALQTRLETNYYNRICLSSTCSLKFSSLPPRGLRVFWDKRQRPVHRLDSWPPSNTTLPDKRQQTRVGLLQSLLNELHSQLRCVNIDFRAILTLHVTHHYS